MRRSTTYRFDTERAQRPFQAQPDGQFQNLHCIHPAATVVVSVVAALFTALSASANVIVLDPDSYANQTDLTHAIPQVSLLTAVSSDNQTVVPSWYISAVTDSYASTGSNVFGYLNFHSLWDARRLRMDFSAPVSSVSIDFISTGSDAGELHIFDSSWHELGAGFITPALAAHQVQTMSLTSPTANIAHAVAYSQGTGFGRLDNLQFAVPEPACSILGIIGALAIGTARIARRGRNLATFHRLGAIGDRDSISDDLL